MIDDRSTPTSNVFIFSQISGLGGKVQFFQRDQSSSIHRQFQFGFYSDDLQDEIIEWNQSNLKSQGLLWTLGKQKPFADFS